MKFVRAFGGLFFLVVSGFLIFGYYEALREKIDRPNIKNLNNREFFWAGLIIVGIVVIDIIIMRYFIRKLKGGKNH